MLELGHPYGSLSPVNLCHIGNPTQHPTAAWHHCSPLPSSAFLT
jgi:hypothetical protein